MINPKDDDERQQWWPSVATCNGWTEPGTGGGGGWMMALVNCNIEIRQLQLTAVEENDKGGSGRKEC